MLDWLAYWGVTQAAGLIFKPILEDLAKDAAKDWAKDLLKGIPGKIFQKLKKEDIEIAAGKALKEFLQLMQQQLKVRCKLTEAEIKEYTTDIQKFISDKSVTEILGKAFDINCESLDAKTLEDSWNRLQLKPLPSKFNWQSITEQYLIQVQEILLDSKELHHILELQNLSDIEINTKEIAGVIVDFNLVKYQEGIRERYGNLKLDSLDTSGYAYNELKLWRIFTAQNVRETHQVLAQVHELPKEHLRRLRESDQVEAEVELEELERHKRVYFEQPIRSVLDVVNKKQDYKYLVILGDPGSGKSTLLQFLALNWAESPLDNVISLPIPLLIELRTYMRRREDKECNNFLEFFHNCSGAVHHLNQLELDKQLKAGNALVMFDGLDEVFDPGKREDVITDIHRFTNDYPDVQVIVTSRIIGYKPQRLLNAEFRHFILQDLDSEQIQDFIYRWHELTFTDAVDKVRKRERLQRGIAASKSIAELAGNPLLLTMMAILNRNQELPRDRATLYDQASRVLLHQWDVERVLIEDKRLDPKTIDYKDKQAMLRQVAYLMQTGDKGLAGNLINENDLVKVLTDYLKTIEFDKPREVARVIINQLRTRNFMLCFLGADYYAFVHRTFLEYFCAWEFVWQFKETQILSIDNLKEDVFGKHWWDESWHEVLRLIAGMIDTQFVGQIITYLMAIDGEHEKFVNLFLAADCLAEVRNRRVIESTADELLKQVKDLIKYDLPYYYFRNLVEYTNLFDKIRARAVKVIAVIWTEERNTLPFLRECAINDDDEYVRSAALSALATYFKEDPDTLPLLKECAIKDAYAVVKEAAVEALVSSYKEDAETLPFLKEGATSDDYGWIHRTALSPLVTYFKEDPDTLSIIKYWSTLDDWRKRSAAVETLGNNYKDDPDTFSILKHCTSTDNDWRVRSAAVRTLGNNYKDDPDTFSILKHFASTDNDWRVRSATVYAIVSNFKEHPDTLPFLKHRATADNDENLQREAVYVIASNFKEHPDTLPFLKHCATADDRQGVRSTAVGKLAENYKDDPDTLPILKHFATASDEMVQRAVVQGLVYNYTDDCDTLPFLKHCATTDDYERVRRIAVQGLADSYKDDPDTLAILKHSATNDDHAEVRSAAVEALGKYFQYQPELFDIYYNCAVNDPFQHQEKRKIVWEINPRRIALEIIIKQFPQHPKTLPLLRDRTENDPDEQVREFAQKKLKQWEG
ncbi:HEAT repeat domain-containing protein [Nostoc sp.]|uniref:HEAT repeat domain-containing protein n=1 Tax=Nostoc sp. TaxID=1180 RepID=UPI002FFB685C